MLSRAPTAFENSRTNPSVSKPRKSLSFLLPSRSTFKKDSSRFSKKLVSGFSSTSSGGEKLQVENNDVPQAAKSSEPPPTNSSNISLADTSSTETPPNGRWELCVANPDPSSDEEELEPLSLKEDTADDNTVKEPETQAGDKDVSRPLHVLSTPPSTDSSPSMNKNVNSATEDGHWSVRGWKVAGRLNSISNTAEVVRRQSKIIADDEYSPPHQPKSPPPASTPRVVLGPASPTTTSSNSAGSGLPSPAPDRSRAASMDISRSSSFWVRQPTDSEKIESMPPLRMPMPVPSSSASSVVTTRWMMTPTPSPGSPGPIVKTSTNMAAMLSPNHQSKYTKASYSLTNNPDAIKMYRDMAEKTKDPLVQLSYAKYLLEIANLYGERRPMSTDGHALPPRASLDTQVSAPAASTGTRVLSDASRRRKKMLEDEGVRWIKLLSKKQVGGAAYLQAKWIEHGMYGFKKSTSKAFKLYKIAASAQIPEAMYAVGKALEETGEKEQAYEQYKGAAEKGVVEAIFRIAKVHLHGELGQRQNMSMALDLLHQAADRATEAFPEPPFLFGLVLTNTYPQADIPSEVIYRYGGEMTGVRYLEHAAQLGHPEAMTRIGYIYEHGLYGTPVHLAKSFGYYDVASCQHNEPLAMLGLSRLYNRGCHGPGDTVQEQERLVRDVSGWLAATARNEDAAFSWCQKAANLGLDEAMFLLGWYYEAGIGVLRDYSKAQEYFRKAAARGHAGAIERLRKTNSVTRQQHEETGLRRPSNHCVLM